MQDKNSQSFEFLKMEIVKTLRLSHPAVSEKIEEWKGQTIILFQEDLAHKVNELISERWFYLHMKSDKASLPRIDVLNMLSRYVGFTDWVDFIYRNQGKIFVETRDKSNKIFFVVPLITIFVLILFYSLFHFLSTREYLFCFVNADDIPGIAKNGVEMEIIDQEESAILLQSDSNGCIRVKTDKVKIQFIVRSPYCQTDTMVRVLRKFGREETVKMKTDDYALMLHYFSNSKVEDWKRRRAQLDGILADSVRIYEVMNKGKIGVEMYSKRDFINKLTMPTSSLRQVEILDTQYADDKIVLIRFTQNIIP